MQQPEGTQRYNFGISDARIEEPNNYTGDYSLRLELRGHGKKASSAVVHLIVGIPLSADFMRDMKVSKVEQLIGEEVFAFVNDRQMQLNGIASKK